MTTFQIKRRFTGAVLYETEAESLADAVVRAVANRADLSKADLRGVEFEYGASLDGASLVGASLDGASLDGASLVGASLVGARLDGARLTPIRDDLWAVLSAAPSEVEGLRAALLAGQVDGSSYSGECACLVGTLANVAHVNYNHLPNLKPNANRPAECFFLGIAKGDTPTTNQFAALVLEWIDLWLANMRAAFGPQPLLERQ